MFLRRIVTVSALCLLAAVPSVSAQDVTFRFTGEITQVYSQSSFQDIVEGTPFTGAYTFSLNSADTNGFATVGDYWHNSSPYGVAV